MDVWPFRPNWREPFTVTYAFLTEIISSEDGHEQRRAWRQTPRRTFEYLVTVNETKFRRLMRALQHVQGQVMRAPEWTRSQKTASVFPVGGTTVVFPHITSGAPDWAVVGNIVTITYEDRIELRTISAVSIGNVIVPAPLNLTFLEPNAVSWPAGSKISPAPLGQVSSQIAGTALTRGLIEVSIRFELEPGREPVLTSFGTPAAMFNGREVFLERANWASGQDIDISRDVRTVDYSFGRTETYLPNAFATDTRGFDFLGGSRTSIQRVINFFYRMRGRQGEFYLPSDAPDLTLAENAAVGAGSILVGGVDISEIYTGDPVYKAISILDISGNRQYRNIENLTVEGENTRLDLDTALTYAVTSTTVEVISWLPVCRLASDTISVEWRHDQLASIRLPYQTVLALEAELP